MNPYVTRRTDVDPALLAEFNAGVMFSRLAYETENPIAPEGIDYARRIAASKKTQRSQRRKKERGQ